MPTHTRVVLALAAALSLPGCREATDPRPSRPLEVIVQTPTVETVPLFLEENGQTEAVQQAVVRARVRGILEKIPGEAEFVKQGDPLFEIEKQEYEAEVTAAKAAVAGAKAARRSALAEVEVSKAALTAATAAIEVAEKNFNRQDGLLKQNAIARSEWESAKADLDRARAASQGAEAGIGAAEAAVSNAEAELQKAEAKLEQAELNLNWTTVRAPIDGRITRTMVKQGNLVEDGTELIEIVQNDPIWANFYISERFLLELERRSNRDRKIQPGTIPVSLKRSGDPDFIFHGFLDYADPKVDQATGRMELRAVFDNPDPRRMLLPGLFVRVRVRVGEVQDALLIPERAVGRDPVGSYVYVVDDDQTVLRKDVQTGTRYEGRIVIQSGLDAGDRVIVDGIQRVRPGITVKTP
jgi:RND family efflux transporter MFP subunit